MNDFIKVKSDHKFIIDDETYFTLDRTKSQPKHYYSVNGKNISKTSSKLPKDKYPLKIMLCLSISEKGISKPVFLKDNKRLTGMFYSKFCIPKIKEFIEKHHKRDKIVFWPDLASSHYSKVSLDTLHKLKIEYIPKVYNPLKYPQIRPIEDFWAHLKRRVYENGRVFKNTQELYCRIKYVLKTIDISGFKNSMKNLSKKIKRANNVGLNDLN